MTNPNLRTYIYIIIYIYTLQRCVLQYTITRGLMDKHQLSISSIDDQSIFWIHTEYAMNIHCCKVVPPIKHRDIPAIRPTTNLLDNNELQGTQEELFGGSEIKVYPKVQPSNSEEHLSVTIVCGKHRISRVGEWKPKVLNITRYCKLTDRELENHHLSWVNQPTKWSFSLARLC